MIARRKLWRTFTSPSARSSGGHYGRSRLFVLGVLACHSALAYGQVSVGQGLETGGGGALLPSAVATTRDGTVSNPPDASGRGGLIIEPRIEIVETYTNNSTLSGAERRSDLITEISPGIRISSNGGRVKGLFDYSLRGLVYADGSSPNTTQQRLNAFGSIEAISNWAFVDLAGSISRQSISAFGTQTVDTSRANANLTDVSAYSISPYVRGRFADAADYELRYRRQISNVEAAAASDVSTSDWRGQLSEEYTAQRVGWGVQAARNTVDYSAGRDTEADRIRGVLSFVATPQLRLFVSGGQESNNYLSLEKKSSANTGFGLRWSPTERIRVEAERERRFFGTGHKFIVDHRMQRMAWRFSDTRDTVVSQSLEALGTQGALFDVLFNQLSSIEPDPIRRAQLVNNFLRANGLDSNSPPGSAFLPSAITVQRLQQLSLSILGVRDAITFLGNRSENRRVDGLAVVADDFSNTDVIRQRGISVTYARRLTPRSGINFLVLLQESRGSLSFQDSTLRTYSFNYTNRIGSNTDFSVGARRSNFSGGLNSYNELAVFGRVTVRF